MKLSEAIRQYIYVNDDGKGRNIPINFIDRGQLIVGIAVEIEHGSDINKRLSIAIDHLAENKTYYTTLIKSGLVDEARALTLANKYLGIDMEKNGEDEELTNILLGQKPLNKNDYSK